MSMNRFQYKNAHKNNTVKHYNTILTLPILCGQCKIQDLYLRELPTNWVFTGFSTFFLNSISFIENILKSAVVPY